VTIPSPDVTVTVQNTDGQAEPGLKVYVFDETTYTGFNKTTAASGVVTFTLPEGEYRFRADKNGTQFWSSETNHCPVPGCATAVVTTSVPVAVTVADTDGQVEPGLKVYAFDETTYTGYNKTTDASGVVTFTLPLGDYRFRADKNGTQFWSSEANHCPVPGCVTAVVTTSVPVTVTVADTNGNPEPGLKVYAFDETTYTGYNKTTTISGVVTFTLPMGHYRFRADKEGKQYWSSESNHCPVPGCLTATITTPGRLGLNINKTGPATALAGKPITYTLTVTNSGSLTTTNLVITDTIPAGTSYITGGVRIDGGASGAGVVSWTLPALAVSSTVQVQFVVTPPDVVTTTETITNSDYAVSADGPSPGSGQVIAVGEVSVATLVYPPAVAGFYAGTVSGVAPLTVTFTSTSTGASTLRWNFGDGISQTLVASDSDILPPSSFTHTYTQTGIYTVSLTASNGLMTGTLTRTAYVTVTGTITRDWRLITTTVSSPVVGEQALAYDPDREIVILYGGNATGWPYEDTTWEFDGTDWISVATTLSPAARYGAQMGYDGSQIILFGGSDESDTALNQTWVYSDTEWSQLSPATAPLSRTYHSLAADPISGTLYLFGGNDETAYFNDLWQYEEGTWSEITLTGDKPQPRTLTALTYDMDNNRLLLFGGRSVTGTLLADLWTFDLSTETWQLLDDGGGPSSGSGTSPPARQAHSLTYDPATGQVVLVGGTTDEGDTLLDDTWHYTDSGWTEATPVTTLPPRAYHEAIYTGDGIVLFSDGEVWNYE
jgi:uncharacterized repeat protein (TIGR01451 family)